MLINRSCNIREFRTGALFFSDFEWRISEWSDVSHSQSPAGAQQSPILRYWMYPALIPSFVFSPAGPDMIYSTQTQPRKQMLSIDRATLESFGREVLYFSDFKSRLPEWSGVLHFRARGWRKKKLGISAGYTRYSKWETDVHLQDFGNEKRRLILKSFIQNLKNKNSSPKLAIVRLPLRNMSCCCRWYRSGIHPSWKI